VLNYVKRYSIVNDPLIPISCDNLAIYQFQWSRPLFPHNLFPTRFVPLDASAGAALLFNCPLCVYGLPLTALTRRLIAAIRTDPPVSGKRDLDSPPVMPYKSFFPLPSSKSSVIDSFGPPIPENTTPFRNMTGTRPSMPPSVHTDVPTSPTMSSPGATIRPRRNTAPSDYEDSTMRTWRQQRAGMDSEPSTVASEAFPTGTGTGTGYVSSLPPVGRQLDGLGIDARRRMAEELVTESLFIVDEGTRRRSLEDGALKEQVQKELDEETVKLSRIQEQRRRAQQQQQQNDRLGNDLRRAGWGRDFRSRSTTELPHMSPSSDTAYQPGHRSQHSEPTAPPPAPTTSAKPRPSSNPPSSSASRLLHGLQQQWWKTEEKRRRFENEKERLRQQEELAREVRALEDAWTIYESRWNLLNMTARSPTPMGHSREQTSRVQLAFTDIPWPTVQPPRSKYDLTSVTLSAFFLSRHLPAGRTTKERLRDALLRWHPDRFEGRYLDKIRPQDREDVIGGVGTVVRYLNSILTTAA